MAAAVETKCTALPETTNKIVASDLDKKIVKQVEFYFGDLNLLRDTFLLEEIKKDNGWVEVDVLLRFNRLKQLTTDRAVVINALAQSKSDLLEVNKDDLKVRRSEARPLPTSNDGSKGVAILNPQTVYVKGFELDSTLDTVLEYFEKIGYPAEGVYMRKNKKTNEFKGSVFVTMPSREAAVKFVEAAPKKNGELDVIVMLKEDYHVKKAQERVNMRQEQKKRQDEIYEEKKKKAVEDQLQKITNEITPGAVLVLGDLPDGLHERVLRTYWGNYARTAWVDFSEDRKTAHVRFEEAESAKKAWEAARAAHPVADNENAVTLENAPVTLIKVLEGEEEQTFWKTVWAKLAERRATYHQNRPGGARGGRGGARGGARGRGSRGGYKGGDKRPHDGQDFNARNKKEIHMEDSDTSDDNNGEN